MTPTNRRHDTGDGVRHDTSDFLHNPDVAHEHSDVNIQALLTFAVGLAVATVFSAIVVWGVFRYLAHEAAANDPLVSPLAVQTSDVPREVGIKGGDPGALTSFPLPRLQTNEPQGLKQFRETETQALESYGWVDQKSGVARIPIEEAKKLLLQRGIPVRSGAAPDALLGTHAQAMGEASGGRNIPPKGGQ